MKIRTPPPPPSHSATRAAPPPPPPSYHAATAATPTTHGAAAAHAQSSFMPPRPPPPPGAFGAVSMSYVSTGASASAVSPAFAQQVAKMPTEQLKNLATSLRMQMFHARLTGNPARAADAQRKLTYVENQMHQRQVKQEMVSRFQYQRQVGGMSNNELSAARSKEGQALFTAFFRGDMAGVKEAQSKLSILDAEIGKRTSELAQFSQSLSEMSPAELDKMETQLANQFADVLFNPQASGAQRDDIFNKLSMLVGELVGRSIGGAVASTFNGCFAAERPADYAK